MSIKTKLQTGALALLTVAVAAFVFLVAMVAHGLPASQPAVRAPVAVVAKALPSTPVSAPLAHAALLAPAKVVVVPASQPVVAKVAVAPASQPASQPTIKVPAGFLPWLQTNANWFVPLLIFLLSSLVTVLSKYPRAKGLIAALRMFMGGLSLLEFKDGKRPGLALKWPVSAPLPPPVATADVTPVAPVTPVTPVTPTDAAGK
jgi:hypothetical protein